MISPVSPEQGPPEGLQHGQSAPTELSRFQKRLVYQLIRSQYAHTLVAFNRRDSLHVRTRDEAREQEIVEARTKRVRQNIVNQTAFRWLIEALTVDGNLDTLGENVAMFARSTKTGENIACDLNELRSRFDHLQSRLRQHRPALVGHNVLVDLVNLYRCFIGPLPLSVTDFMSQIHAMFPIIVDTKYLATHGCGDLPSNSSLEFIEAQLRELNEPAIRKPAPLVFCR